MDRVQLGIVEAEFTAKLCQLKCQRPWPHGQRERDASDMDIHELLRLATWYTGQFSELIGLYNALREPINHNANQPDKRPIEAQLNALTDFLANQRFDELSIEQLKMLTSLEVSAYLGRDGAAYVNGVVRTSDYDPATAAQRLNASTQALNRARDLLTAYAEAVASLGFDGDKARLQMISLQFASDSRMTWR